MHKLSEILMQANQSAYLDQIDVNLSAFQLEDCCKKIICDLRNSDQLAIASVVELDFNELPNHNFRYEETYINQDLLTSDDNNNPVGQPMVLVINNEIYLAKLNALEENTKVGYKRRCRHKFRLNSHVRWRHGLQASR
ncbi:hypothetical protein TcasGA2_TC004200 [Tribolium castaneum]|uniref:Uncharacterized protein n=1 Tax=Tribolium castaneum TaxID=7070 RepID=D7EJ42_TRICA|nr:hypothetical protein TcasGA2_TC004200 [Tribolium castaneum]